MSEAIQNARRWLAAYDSQPDGQSGIAAMGAHHVRQLLDEMALQGRRPVEAGYEWMMGNVDELLAQAVTDGNEHRHHEEDVGIRLAMVRSNQAVAAAIWDGNRPTDSRWDVVTAKEADAFQQIMRAVLATPLGSLRQLPGYPDDQASAVIALCDHDGTVSAEVICEALVEAGPWDEIDGDGTDESLIVEHIGRLGKMAFSTGQLTELQVQRMGAAIEEARKLILVVLSGVPGDSEPYKILDTSQSRLADALDEVVGWVGVTCKHGPTLVNGVIGDMRAATDGDGIRLTITGELADGVDIRHAMLVTVHEATRSDDTAAPTA